MTNCKPIQNLLLTSYLDGMSTPEEKRLVDIHLANCADCRQTLTALMLQEKELNTAGVKQPPAYLWENIKAEILSEKITFWQQCALALQRLFLNQPRWALAGLAVMTALTIISTPLFWSIRPDTALKSDEPATIVALVSDREDGLFTDNINLDTNTEFLLQETGETI